MKSKSIVLKDMEHDIKIDPLTSHYTNRGIVNEYPFLVSDTSLFILKYKDLWKHFIGNIDLLSDMS